MIILKSKREIEYIREAGRITANALRLMKKLAKPGITTGELDQRCEEYIRSCGAFPSCKGYYGFPATICASVNEEVVHGIPGHRKLKDGDIISIDLVVNKNGYHGDSTVTIPVGHVHPATLKLLKVTEESSIKASNRPLPGITSATSATQSSRMPNPLDTASSATTSATASVRTCMKIRKCRTTAWQVTANCWNRAWSWPLNR